VPDASLFPTPPPVHVAMHPPPHRYMELPLPGGRGVAHIIAVFPCSTASADEVALVCDRVQPSGLYVDVYPEQLGRLRAEVARYALPEGVDPDSPEAQVCVCVLCVFARVCLCPMYVLRAVCGHVHGMRVAPMHVALTWWWVSRGAWLGINARLCDDHHLARFPFRPSPFATARPRVPCPTSGTCTPTPLASQVPRSCVP
jgi:hypothetical protein